MSILPMVLCGLVICGMYKIHAQNMYQTYEIDSQTFLIDFYSPMELMGKITENIYDDIREIAEENPEKFNDESYLEHIDYRLSEKLSELVVRKNGVYTYQSEVLKEKNIDEQINAFNAYWLITAIFHEIKCNNSILDSANYLRSEIRENHSLQDININVLPVIVKLYLYLIKMNLYVLALLSAKLINRLRRK